MRYCTYFEKKSLLPHEFSQFCAAIIQAQWKRFIIHRAYKKLKEVKSYFFNTKKKKSIQTETGGLTKDTTKHELEFMQLVAPKAIYNDNTRENAAYAIQKLWKKYYVN